MTLYAEKHANCPTCRCTEPVDASSYKNDLVMMPHLLALMEGLEIPNPEWYLQQHPEILRRVGAAIANQAKQAS